MTGLSPAEKLKLEAAMAVLAAEDKLRAGTTDDELHDVALAATGSRWVAAKLLSKRAWERLRNDQVFGEQ